MPSAETKTGSRPEKRLSGSEITGLFRVSYEENRHMHMLNRAITRLADQLRDVTDPSQREAVEYEKTHAADEMISYDKKLYESNDEFSQIITDQLGGPAGYPRLRVTVTDPLKYPDAIQGENGKGSQETISGYFSGVFGPRQLLNVTSEITGESYEIDVLDQIDGYPKVEIAIEGIDFPAERPLI